jgi:hypothetical protein
LGARLGRLASVRPLPILLGVNAWGRTARGTRSAVAVSSASAEPARRSPLPRLRRRLPLPRPRRAQPRRRRALRLRLLLPRLRLRLPLPLRPLCAYPIAPPPPAPATLSAAIDFASKEDVAATRGVSATPTVNAVSAWSASPTAARASRASVDPQEHVSPALVRTQSSCRAAWHPVMTPRLLTCVLPPVQQGTEAIPAAELVKPTAVWPSRKGSPSLITASLAATRARGSAYQGRGSVAPALLLALIHQRPRRGILRSSP